MRPKLVLAEVMGEDGWGYAPDPHPDLVLAQRPHAGDLMQAVAVLGAFPDGSYLSGEIRVSLLTL